MTHALTPVGGTVNSKEWTKHDFQTIDDRCRAESGGAHHPDRLHGQRGGDVSLGIFTLKDIKLNSFVDPLVPGVTCHVASIEANLSLSDPSDSAVSCRQTGEITPAMIARIKRARRAKSSLKSPRAFSSRL